MMLDLQCQPITPPYSVTIMRLYAITYMSLSPIGTEIGVCPRVSEAAIDELN